MGKYDFMTSPGRIIWMAKILTKRSFAIEGANGIAVSNSWVAARLAKSITYAVFGTNWRDCSYLRNEALHLIDELVTVSIGKHIHCSGEGLAAETSRQEICGA
jgi:hypothetical protein